MYVQPQAGVYGQPQQSGGYPPMQQGGGYPPMPQGGKAGQYGAPPGYPGAGQQAYQQPQVIATAPPKYPS